MGKLKINKNAIWNEFFNIETKKVKLEQVYLDPNNPRLAIPNKNVVDDDRIDDPKIQEKYCKELKTNIGISDLTESIKTSGFWTIDRVVLKEFKQNKYVAVEGNRRIAALKTLRDAYDYGDTKFDKKIYDGLIEFEALIYKGDNKEIAWIIQGFRHTPGIKIWEKYPLAKFLADFEKNSKYSIIEITDIFPGLRRNEVAKLIRSYYAFEESKKDDEYGDLLSQDKFGHFYEIIMAKEEIKDWMGWDDNEKKFTKINNIKKYLSWITPADGEKSIIDISPTTRDTLTKLIKSDNTKLFEKFQNKELTLKECNDFLFKEETKKEVLNISDTIKDIENFLITLNTLPIPKLKLAKTPEDKENKKKLKSLLLEIKETLESQIETLK